MSEMYGNLYLTWSEQHSNKIPLPVLMFILLVELALVRIGHLCAVTIHGLFLNYIFLWKSIIEI